MSRLARSPAPYPLRVATAYSIFARHAVTTFSQLTLQLDVPPNFLQADGGTATEEGWHHFNVILAKMQEELRAQEIELVVDVLPNRAALEAADPTNTAGYRARQRVVGISSGLGIRTLDAWDLFATAVQNDGARRYFLGNNDIHFSPAGHRLLAEWLAKQLALPQSG